MPLPELCKQQVNNFIQLTEIPPQVWVGQNIAQWAACISPDLADLYNLPQGALNREQLRAVWQNNNNIDETCVLCTLAWGGMRRSNARAVWNARRHWLPIIRNIREGGYINMFEAYNAFSVLRAQGLLPSMGPAYFTKILFFAQPVNPDARQNDNSVFILDQWTARSAQVLTNQIAWPRLNIDYTTKKKAVENDDPTHIRLHVSDDVSVDDYMHYCSLVRIIASVANRLPSHVEEAMFGMGGRNSSPWRIYLRENGRLYIN